MESRNKLAMCRLCLCENECFINIFDLNDWQGYVAAEVISDLLQFQVSETDGYPHVVCLTCLTKLTDFRLFKECCQKSKVMYDAMFFSCGSLEEHKPEVVEFVTVKAEPIYSSDDEDKVSKANSESVRTKEDESHKKGPVEAISDLEGTDGAEFKQEHIEDEVTETQISYAYPEYSNAEGITSDLITSQMTIKEEPLDVQFTHLETGTHPQQLQSFEHERPHCSRSTGAVVMDSYTKDNSIDNESVFETSKHMSLNDKASSSGTLDRWERQCTLPGEKMSMATSFQENIKKEGEKESGKDEKDTGGDGKSHVLTHTCSKKYKCAECGKSFWRNCDLTRHMRSHTGSKPYKCGECRKSFSQNSSLTIHMRSHTGLKPYKCAECGNSFSQKGNLKTHMRLHTEFLKP